MHATAESVHVYIYKHASSLKCDNIMVGLGLEVRVCVCAREGGGCSYQNFNTHTFTDSVIYTHMHAHTCVFTPSKERGTDDGSQTTTNSTQSLTISIDGASCLCQRGVTDQHHYAGESHHPENPCKRVFKLMLG